MNITKEYFEIKRKPFLFDEFIDSGFEESISPFLTEGSKGWGRLLGLKASIISAVLLLFAFISSFFPNLISLSYLLLVLVYFLAGTSSLISSIEDIFNLEINIDVLMTLAAFLSILIGSPMEGALLLVLFSISGAMEEAVATKATTAIRDLKKITPTKACVILPDGMVLERSVKDISIGTRILIKAGEIVPLDGTVIDGISSVNLVHLTGENLPVVKKIEDTVPAGARNLDGALVMSVTNTSGESTLARLIQLIIQAQEAKPKLQRWIDRFSKTYAMSIIGLATFFALILPWLFAIPYFGIEGSIYRSLAFLIAASPCALVIAIPIGYLSAISACARKGILLKGGITLDALARCNIISFDKTGTLTKGELTCTAFIPIEMYDEKQLQEMLSTALSLERNSTHPIAKAITQLVQSKNLSPVSIIDFRSIPGYGVEGKVEIAGNRLQAYLGHPSYIINGLGESQKALLQERLLTTRQEGKLLTILKVGSGLAIMEFQDTPRNQMKELIVRLKQKFHLKILMLTGDHPVSAKSIADLMGIDEYFADLRPEDKLKHVTQLSQTNHLAMIGDGINDAPALARATVGISMGKVGSSTAIDASDVVLLHDNLESLDWLLDKAHATQRVILQNVILASFAILFATTPALLGFIPLWLAVVLHEGGTVLVGLNSLRLLKK